MASNYFNLHFRMDLDLSNICYDQVQLRDGLELLQAWRAEEKFTDFTLVSSDQKSFPVHKCIIASKSEFMRVLLVSKFCEENSNKLLLRTIESQVILIITLACVIQS